MKYPLLLLCLLSAFAKTALAQTDDFPRDSMDARVTEYYRDVPIVTPGGQPAATPTPAPSDAVVLFDGANLDAWQTPGGGASSWNVADGAVTVAPRSGDLVTRDSFRNFQLHLEYRTPTKVEEDGQGRGNSGIFLQGRYELQILDNYDNPTYANGQVGSIYKQSPPLANASRKPGEWQVYDVFYTEPVWSEATGQVIHPAYVTVMQNGVLLQNHTPILGPTEYKGLPQYVRHGAGPLRLQDHGNTMSFRNIWVRQL